MHIGATLGRRFTLLRPEEFDIPGVERFVANDSRLDTEVWVDIVTSLAPSAVRASAARAALVRDARLARVLTSGRERHDGEQVTYVVTERPVGVRLDEVLDTRVLTPELAGAIIGEAARALKVVTAQGGSHGHFRPASVIVTPRARVVTTGAGFDGELATQAGLTSGRTGERADALAAGKLYVAAVTGMDPADVTRDELPESLPPKAYDLCLAVIKGSGPRTLDEIVTALSPFTATALRGFAATVTALPWRPAIAAEQEALAAERAAQASALAQQVRDSVEVDAETLSAATHLAEVALAETHTQPGFVTQFEAQLETVPPVLYIEGDPDDLLTFDLMAQEQNAKPEPAVWEDLLERLHQRWPRSRRIARGLSWAHRRAQRSGPINAAPLLMGVSVVIVVVATIVAFSILAKPYDPEFRRDNPPANNYPDFTHEPSPSPSATNDE